MKLTDKSAVITILSAVTVPLLLCVVLYAFTQSSDILILGAVYVVFGLPIVLIIGWLLSATTKNTAKPLFWSVVSYLAPVFIICLAIIGVALAA